MKINGKLPISDASYAEWDAVCATNQGEVFVYSLPQLRRQAMRAGAEAVLRKEDAVGIASLLLGAQPLVLYQSSPSEFSLVALSQSRADRVPNGLCFLAPPGIAPETRLAKSAVKKEATQPPVAAAAAPAAATPTPAVKSDAPPPAAAATAPQAAAPAPTPAPASATAAPAAATTAAPAAAPAAAAGASANGAEQAAPAVGAAPATPPSAAAPTGNGQPQGGSPVASTPAAVGTNNNVAHPPQQAEVSPPQTNGEGSPQTTTRLPTDPSLDNITDHAAPTTAPV